ncbi:hypothetical protein KKC94_02320 [Patescibacteria group bacterium]|nr:hypothetical protein [Patescibacteria group bacterium]
MKILRNLALVAALTGCDGRESYHCEVEPNEGSEQLYTYGEVDGYCRANPNDVVSCLRRESGRGSAAAISESDKCDHITDAIQYGIFGEKMQPGCNQIDEIVCYGGGADFYCEDSDWEYENWH